MSYIRPEVYVPPESGSLLCPGCHATYHAQFRDDPCACSPSGPVHDSASDCPCNCAAEPYATPGDTCDGCGAWYADGAWQDGDPHDTALWAWSACDRCNTQTPHPARDRTPVPHDCDDCGARGAVTFPGPWPMWYSDTLTLTLDLSDAQACTHPGPCDRDVADLAARPDVAAQIAQWAPADVVAYLRPYGAWTPEELTDHAQNCARALWSICGAITDSPEDYLQ